MCNWRSVVGFEGAYEVSDAGDVRSLRSKHGPRPAPRVLAQSRTGHGYQSVKLSRDGSTKTMQVHKMVLAAFRGPRPDGMQGRHLDDNQANNSLDNLAWGTHAENVADAMKHGRYRAGSRHGMAKLTDADVDEIRLALGRCAKTTALARRFHVSHSTISRIAHGHGWRAK